MPLDGNGVYTLPAVYNVQAGDDILTAQLKTPLEDVRSALSLAFYRDGRAAMTGQMNGGGFKGVNFANGVALTDLATVGQIPTTAQIGDVDDKIINGDFTIWQRGLSFSASGYAADRWRNSFAGGTCVFSRQDFAAGTAIGNLSPRYFARMVVAGQSATSHFARFEQRIENVTTYANRQVTVMFWARRSVAGDIAVEMAQNFGTGGTPSADVTGIGASKFSVSTTWTPYAVQITLPDLTSKSFGTNGNDFVALNIWASGGTDFNSRTQSLGVQSGTLEIYGVHIRRGAFVPVDAGLYRPISTGETLRLCQRYYEKSYAQDIFPGAAPNYIGVSSCPTGNASIGAIPISCVFKVTKRASPSSVFAYSPLTGAVSTMSDGGGASSPLTYYSVSSTGLILTNGVALGVNGIAMAHWTADAEL